MIEHQVRVHSNAFACLPEYGQSDCGFSHLEMSKYIYGSICIETSVRNKCRCSFYCAHLTLHVSAPIGGHLQVVCNTKIRRQLLYMSTDPLRQYV
jgi:hypothetical protein